jgi:hypothetical protein
VFAPQQKSTGTGYTQTIALLAAAFIFIPGLLLMSRPFGYVSLTLAIVGSAICLVVARINWKKSSQLSIPSIEIEGVKSK